MPIVYHLSGSGCHHCKFSKLEIEIEQMLMENNIEFIAQYRLGRQSLDFYLPQYNIAIECQGGQHFGLGGWGKDYEKKLQHFEQIKERDIRKFNKCNELGIKLLYFTTDLIKDNIDNEFVSIYNENNLITDKNVLLTNILYE